MLKSRLAFGLAAIFLMASPSAFAAETVVLATLEWPPYTTQSMPDDGISAAIVTAAFATEHVRTRYVFLPWNRAIDETSHGAVDGFFPGYAGRHGPLWVASAPISEGPIYFVERKDHPIHWSSLDDLRGRLIGIDAGYINTADIDRRLADGRLHGDPAYSDAQNLRKLAKGRVDLAIIDANVFRFLTSKPDLNALTPVLKLEDKPLENKELYIYFRNDREGRHFQSLLNQGLLKIKAATFDQMAQLQARLMGQ